MEITICCRKPTFGDARFQNLLASQNSLQDFFPKAKFRGIKLGTTEKNYKHAHPSTYFLDSQKNYAARPMFIRGDLEHAKKYSINQLHDLIKFYEKLNAPAAKKRKNK